MDSQGQGNFKLLYRTLKNLKEEDNSSNTNKFIRNKEGKILTEPKEIKKKRHRYFRELLDRVPNEKEDIKYEKSPWLSED
ncbi:hypothetical protein ILUMI_13491 [Ignelater luminosus]|uniref:Uncharacterized protein n=1 Tax=Ignelater luminosus TaxID=2038154 RepID=A0A8K0CXQ1_IGNLU|nr:hypothetical protein ILUMI_13491 [Ignelater luminosus]